MKRLLLITPDFAPGIGGIQLLFERLVGELAGDFDITVVTRRQRAIRPVDPRLAGAAVIQTGTDGRAGLVALNARATALGTSRSFDVVLNGHVTTSPAALAIRRLCGTPFVQYLFADEVPHRARMARRAVHGASSTIAISRHTAELAIAAGCAPERLRSIPPGVDLPPPPIPRTRATRPTIITVARLDDHYKGHDVMMQSIMLIRPRLPDVRWLIVGDGRLRPELEAQAERRGLAENVDFVGSVSDPRRDELLDTAHVFAMPSRLPGTRGGGEGFGIVYLEAGLHGLPVVAGDVAGALDAVIHGKTGLLVDPTSPTALADALYRLLSDRPLAQRLGKAGADHAKTFSWDRMARAVRVTLLEALAHRR